MAAHLRLVSADSLPMVTAALPHDLIDAHLLELRARNLRESTIYQRKRTLIRLQKFLGSTPLLDAGHRDLVAYIGRPGVKPESRACDASHVRQFYEWCIDEEYLTDSPARRIRRPKVPRSAPRPIGEEDLAMALDLCADWMRHWFLLAAFAGMRAGEIAVLRGEHIAWSAGQIHVTGKGGHLEPAAMPTYLADQLRRCDIPFTGWVTPRRDGQPGHMMAWSVSQRAAQFLRSVGIDATIHQFRHRYGTQILRSSGGNLRVAQEAMRHATVTSTQKYTQIAMTEVSAAAEQLPAPSRMLHSVA